ncbi:MAG: hypothetical protein KatS3mg089_0248 [Patescibacteria group bacterium]|nr:MAG: hypothetical protein KatS3mg089_0248 [Patescibacteria group bacterium]
MPNYLDEFKINLEGIDIDEVSSFIQGADFPATKQEILEVAFANGAPEYIIDFLDRLPDEEYSSFADLLFALEDLQLQS